jgi:hypothetical protein
VLWISDDGEVHNLTHVPYDLVVPMDGTPWGKEG